MTRKEVLDAASKAVLEDRTNTYGSPEQSFKRIAEFWSAYLDVDITPADVAAMMGLLKIARIAGGRDTHDSWVDLAGYAACGGELHLEPYTTRVENFIKNLRETNEGG